jgi:hypothetical protein
MVLAFSQLSTNLSLRVEWIFRSIYDFTGFATVVLTKSMNKLKTSFTTTDRNEGIALEAAAVLASPGPLGFITMGTLPLSVIAFGWIRRQKLDDPNADAMSQLGFRL